MSKRAVLEVIALDAEDAVAARAGGADRLELVADMAADGLTPPVATFAAVRAAVDLPLRVMLRLADGFTAGDPAPLVAATRSLREAGADEFVLGFLDRDGGPDLAVLDLLTAELAGCRWTFHRAIDRAADRAGLRKLLADLPGLDTYLSAGSASGVAHGLPTLCAEAARHGEPGYTQRLMAGGGLTLAHVPALRAAGIDAFHIGGAARPGGWTGPVSAEAVRRWRTAVDERETPRPQEP
ncbi:MULTISPECIES: copper homeostasis protein CutC [Streptomyces]|uniref:copper homeostasis protein CutC n=1 Tax=Streptomyces TaxID=1883 RepID=UPI00177B70F2|nr:MULTISPECIES: copper homeostasis protein CutC [unclassified Streptomyces]WTI27489.1 copper homeostasis protein CutC [Streptomyces jietaisiensis]GHE34951.1 copper homeostasis protein CutC [Streptomyces griseoaurantiacus]MDX3087477.1 copper homeostasis protein CutC [Streptomyces sp. ME12-02E]MDX3330832.1 copper homeostasis protein CutC [Streptomyces sp. ME02-6978a]MDX3359811.1 copper homeostasis protein CutC [Streptomyces sp. ME02-6978.2a]